MARRDPDRLRSYLHLITRQQGGLESAIHTIASLERTSADTGGLESMTAGADAVELARQGAETLALNQTPSEVQYDNLEAIIFADLRPAIDIVDGTFTVTHRLWTRLSTDPIIKQRIESVLPSIGRIELSGLANCPYGGTGFVVGDGLIMTNRHVAELFARGLGDRSLTFISGRTGGIDFLRELGRPTGPTLQVRRVVMIHPYWDMALLAVDGLPAGRKPLKLAVADARDLQGQDIFVVGYPAFDSRNALNDQQTVFGGQYGIKRLQPGQLHGGMPTASFGKVVPAATHDCSTLGGNSGSAVIDLASAEVMALHFGGMPQKQNYCVPAAELARDQRVIDAGVQFASTPSGGTPAWSGWWQRADTTEATKEDVPTPAASELRSAPAAALVTPPSAAAIIGNDGTIRIEVPLHITIALGTPAVMRSDTATEAVANLATAPLTAGEDALEAMREPFHDADYATRRGYDADFLNLPGGNADLPHVQVAMPTASNPDLCALTLAGGGVLDYQNFSIVMHAARRLALICACNVTREPQLRRPDATGDYTRRGLSGLGEHDQERWYPDPRLAAEFQLPDVFFTKDRGAFDKGHIIRRDDIAWGASYDLLRRANGDSYHVTNCSPQTAAFNRSSDGIANWGDLENHVLAEAANERLCVFAGPVLTDSDRTFTGVGAGGVQLQAKIPARFWKVIVARTTEGIAAYGFVLEQDLADTPLEFTVLPEFAPVMYPITEIEAMTGVTFADAVHAADQYETSRGDEMSMRSGTTRRRRN